MKAVAGLDEFARDLVKSFLQIEDWGGKLPSEIVLYGANEGLRGEIASMITRTLPTCSTMKTVSVYSVEKQPESRDDRYCVDLGYFLAVGLVGDEWEASR